VATHNLTANFVDKTPLPTEGEVFYRDRSIRGFALRVNWGGTKSWILEGRVHGRVRRMTLGRHPVMTLAQARQKALEWKSTITTGGDPTANDERNTTFKTLADRYIEHARLHKKSWSGDARMLELYVPKAWNTRRLSDLTRNEIVKLHDQVGESHGRYAANRLMSLLRRMLNLARDWNLFAGANPAERVERFDEPARERFLSPEELQRVNDALLAEPNPDWRAYFPLCLLLGTRKSELLSAKWSDVDLEQKIWQIPTTKSGKSHRLPLSAPAMAIIEALPSRGASPWLFPSSGATGHLATPGHAWHRIRDRAKVHDVRIHDLRRTFGSWLAGAGFSLPMIGRALNHASPASTSVYARLNIDPVRAMMEANAQLMIGSGGQ
jgi:integrase